MRRHTIIRGLAAALALGVGAGRAAAQGPTIDTGGTASPGGITSTLGPLPGSGVNTLGSQPGGSTSVLSAPSQCCSIFVG